MQTYPLREEIWHIVSHGVGIACGLVALGIAIQTLYSGSYPVIAHVAMWIYTLSVILLYTCSTLYHSVFALPQVRRWCRRLDHASIYIMIAGSYTPFLWIALARHHGFSWSIVIWTIALIGGTIKLCFAGRFPLLSTACYLGMGWLSVFLLPDLLITVPMPGLYTLLAGGISYSVGAAFYLWKRLPYHHAIWHFLVLIGSICQWVSIQYYVLPGGLL